MYLALPVLTPTIGKKGVMINRRRCQHKCRMVIFMLYKYQTQSAFAVGRGIKPLGITLLLIFLIALSGCQPQPSQMERLGMSSLGLVVETEHRDYLEPIITTYIQRKLPKVSITGSQMISDYLGIPLGSGYPSLLERLNSANALPGLEEDLGIEYLVAMSIEAEESPRHTTSLTIGTEKTELQLSQYKAIILHYMVIDTSTGETVFSGQARGKSSDIADFKVGTTGTKVGIQLAAERDLLREAVRNALKETGLF